MTHASRARPHVLYPCGTICAPRGCAFSRHPKPLVAACTRRIVDKTALAYGRAQSGLNTIVNSCDHTIFPWRYENVWKSLSVRSERTDAWAHFLLCAHFPDGVSNPPTRSRMRLTREMAGLAPLCSGGTAVRRRNCGARIRSNCICDQVICAARSLCA